MIVELLIKAIGSLKLTSKKGITYNSRKEQKGILRQKFGFLSEIASLFEEKLKEEVLARLQIMTKKSKAELIKTIYS